MAAQGGIDPAIFESLQSKIDEDTAFGDKLKDIRQQLEKQTKSVQAILSRTHSTPFANVPDVLNAASAGIRSEIDTIKQLSEVTSTQPYYKWNAMYTRSVQDVCLTLLLFGWLGGDVGLPDAKVGRLITLEEMGKIINVPVNLKDRDAFHITIEEYLQALISLLEELARLARNSVTLGDYSRPLLISQFIKDIHAGFQILNLKNDSLRKRSDGIKYRVKEVEDVVYDLSLRNLLPKSE